MEIGEIIRRCRKQKNLTQEEMANRLGVTAPAVNKWENGGSLPDITMLAPIARLLDITVDTLLSFRDNLTPEESLKLEIAAEIGVYDKVLENGWRSLTAKESGRIGGLMTRRKKAQEKAEQRKE